MRIIAKFGISRNIGNGFNMAKNTVRCVITTAQWRWGKKTYIALAGGLALCGISIDDIDTRIGWLHDVVVNPSVRRKGYGNMLLEIAKEQARKQGCLYLHLWVELDSWMEEWYKRHGFEQYGISLKDKQNILRYTL